MAFLIRAPARGPSLWGRQRARRSDLASSVGRIPPAVRYVGCATPAAGAPLRGADDILYRVVISHLRERTHLAATARGVFNPHLIGDQPIAQAAAAAAYQGLAELLHARLQPAPPHSDFPAPPAPGPRPTAAQPAASYLAEVLHKALSPSSPNALEPLDALLPRPCPPSMSPLASVSARESSDPRGAGTREPFTVPSA